MQSISHALFWRSNTTVSIYLWNYTIIVTGEGARLTGSGSPKAKSYPLTALLYIKFYPTQLWISQVHIVWLDLAWKKSKSSKIGSDNPVLGTKHENGIIRALFKSSLPMWPYGASRPDAWGTSAHTWKESRNGQAAKDSKALTTSQCFRWAT